VLNLQVNKSKSAKSNFLRKFQQMHAKHANGPERNGDPGQSIQPGSICVLRVHLPVFA
jgi:hypothetical protein